MIYCCKLKQRTNLKQCSKCKTIKENSEFYKDNRHTDGLFSECKKCKNLKSLTED